MERNLRARSALWVNFGPPLPLRLDSAPAIVHLTERRERRRVHVARAAAARIVAEPSAVGGPHEVMSEDGHRMLSGEIAACGLAKPPAVIGAWPEYIRTFSICQGPTRARRYSSPSRSVVTTSLSGCFRNRGALGASPPASFGAVKACTSSIA